MSPLVVISVVGCQDLMLSHDARTFQCLGKDDKKLKACYDDDDDGGGVGLSLMGIDGVFAVESSVNRGQQESVNRGQQTVKCRNSVKQSVKWAV